MKICFLDPAELDYTALRPDSSALPDAQVMLCYLARALAASEHKITLLNQTSQPGEHAGVTCLNINSVAAEFWAGVDVVIGIELSSLLTLPAGCRRIFWNQDQTELPELGQALADGRIDKIVCVSYWQYLQLWRQSPLAPDAIKLLPNLAAPAFFAKQPDPERMSTATAKEFLIVASGLTADEINFLEDLLPLLQQRFARLRLQIFTDKSQLAQTLGKAHLAVLPGLDERSDCLALREAQSAGCRVVTSDRGARTEISGGLARLVPWSESDYQQEYKAAVIEELDYWQQNPQMMHTWLASHAKQMPVTANWQSYSQDWVELLEARQRPALQITPKPLRWCFIDSADLDYQVSSPETIPLGGSQSALCYLARTLARRGHQVTLVNQTSQPGRYLGVECLNQQDLRPEFWQQNDFDLLIALNDFKALAAVKEVPGRRVFWNQHNTGVPGVEKLPQALHFIDTVVYVSAWQQADFQARFGLPAGVIIPNAVAPFYLPMPDSRLHWPGLKPGPLTLAFTSTPNRGLFILMAIFPGLRQLFPGLRLKVFSSLRVYQSPEQEEAEFLQIYAECRRAEGVEYHGSLPQAELAAALRGVHVLAYPNVYHETSCIAAMEAMAAGCQIVTSDLGALPETTAGFARLVPFVPDTLSFGRAYFDALCKDLQQWNTNPIAQLEAMQTQSRYALENYNWEVQVLRWEELGRRICK